jgi:hypothetical protein
MTVSGYVESASNLASDRNPWKLPEPPFSFSVHDPWSTPRLPGSGRLFLHPRFLPFSAATRPLPRHLHHPPALLKDWRAE